jgi:hypothetical protein
MKVRKEGHLILNRSLLGTPEAFLEFHKNVTVGPKKKKSKKTMARRNSNSSFKEIVAMKSSTNSVF